MNSHDCVFSQKTRVTDPLLVYCWSTVHNAGPTLNQHWMIVSFCWAVPTKRKTLQHCDNSNRKTLTKLRDIDPMLFWCWANVTTTLGQQMQDIDQIARHWSNVVLMLGQRHKRWAAINTTLGQYIVFVGRCLITARPESTPVPCAKPRCTVSCVSGHTLHSAVTITTNHTVFITNCQLCHTVSYITQTSCLTAQPAVNLSTLVSWTLWFLRWHVLHIYISSVGPNSFLLYSHYFCVSVWFFSYRAYSVQFFSLWDVFCENQWPWPLLFSPSWLIQWSMGEESYITLFSPSDVTEFHRMKYGGGGLNHLVFTEWSHCVSQNTGTSSYRTRFVF